MTTEATTDAERATISGRDFLILWVELALVFTAAFVLNIEQTHGLSRILPLLFLGFAVNAWTPLRYRPGVFLLLCFLSIVLILGPWDSLWLFGIGMALIGLCHLPYPLGLRVVLLLGRSDIERRLRKYFLLKNSIVENNHSARLIDLRFDDQIVLRNGI